MKPRYLFLLFLLACNAPQEQAKAPAADTVVTHDTVTAQPAPADSAVVYDTVVIDQSIGMVVRNDAVHTDSSFQFDLYNKDGSLWRHVDYPGDFNNWPQLSPYGFWEDYDILHFSCKAIDSTSYHIIVHDKKGIIKSLRRKDIRFKLQTWPEYVLSNASVGFDEKSNPLRTEPNEKAATQPVDKEQFYRPEKVQGQWLQVKDDDDKTFWIKWYKKGRLLVELFPTC